MKRTAFAALAVSFLAAPVFPAGAMPTVKPDLSVKTSSALTAEQIRWVRRGVAVRPVWAVGRVHPFWPRLVVRDFVRFGLRAPGPGLVWVRDGGRFLLVRTATGAVVPVR